MVLALALLLNLQINGLDFLLELQFLFLLLLFKLLPLFSIK